MAQHVFSTNCEFFHTCAWTSEQFSLTLSKIGLTGGNWWGFGMREKSNFSISTGFINEMPLKYVEISNRL